MIEFKVVTEIDLRKAILMHGCHWNHLNGCWEWQRGRDKRGYGFFNKGGKTRRASRVSYETFIGPIPDGHVVRHACDNPRCINPNHLLTGTQRENVLDREARGRRDVKGEQIGTAKLTTEQALEIKRSKEPCKVLSERFGIHECSVSRIRSGAGWKHLNKEAVAISE